jgi:hypothetical protein
LIDFNRWISILYIIIYIYYNIYNIYIYYIYIYYTCYNHVINFIYVPWLCLKIIWTYQWNGDGSHSPGWPEPTRRDASALKSQFPIKGIQISSSHLTYGRPPYLISEWMWTGDKSVRISRSESFIIWSRTAAHNWTLSARKNVDHHGRS